MWGNSFFRWAERVESQMRSAYYQSAPPSTLGDTDYDAFDVAVKARREPIRNQKQIEDILNRKNPVHLSRMRRDYKWCQKQYIKLGLNPEDVQCLL